MWSENKKHCNVFKRRRQWILFFSLNQVESRVRQCVWQWFINSFIVHANVFACECYKNGFTHKHFITLCTHLAFQVWIFYGFSFYFEIIEYFHKKEVVSYLFFFLSVFTLFAFIWSKCIYKRAMNIHTYMRERERERRNIFWIEYLHESKPACTLSKNDLHNAVHKLPTLCQMLTHIFGYRLLRINRWKS